MVYPSGIGLPGLSWKKAIKQLLLIPSVQKMDENVHILLLLYQGLRGAMAFALAIRNTSTPARQTILSTTLIIVIVTVILCGGFTTLVLQWLKIRLAEPLLLGLLSYYQLCYIDTRS